MADDASIKPWMRGPLELIRHAEGHYQADSDFDKRMALIGFDNAIEVAISAYLDLNPIQRNGMELPREDVRRWTRSYHSRIEFLEHLAGKKGVELPVVPAEVIWFHSLRNRLYHGGNGVVPEAEQVSGIREAAVAIYSFIYDVVPDMVIGLAETAGPPLPQTIDQNTRAAEIELLDATDDFASALERALDRMGQDLKGIEPTIIRLWQLFSSISSSVPGEYQWIVHDALIEAVAIRFGDSTAAQSIIREHASRLQTVTEFVTSYVRSENLLNALRRGRYGGRVKPDLTAVYLEISDGVVNIVTHSASKGLRTVDMDFIANDYDGPDEYVVANYFSIALSAQDNARRLLNEPTNIAEPILGFGGVIE